MGLETPVSIILGDLMGIGCHPECRQVSVLAGVAEEDMAKGTELKVHGHHHAIDGLVPELLEAKEAGNAAPFYLLSRYYTFKRCEERTADYSGRCGSVRTGNL